MLFRLLRSLKKRVFGNPKAPHAVSEMFRRRGMDIGEGTLIYPNVVMGRGGADPITIGKNCVLTGCAIIGHDASANAFLGIRKSVCIPVKIGDNCFIGHGAIVLMGVTIGDNCIVGAGAVVTKDIPSDSVVAGNPAKVICSLHELVDKRKKLASIHPEYFQELPTGISDE